MSKHKKIIYSCVGILILTLLFFINKFNKDVIIMRESDRTWVAVDKLEDPLKSQITMKCIIKNNVNKSGPYTIICRIKNEKIASIIGQREITLSQDRRFEYRREYLVFEGALYRGKDINELDKEDIDRTFEIIVKKNNKIIDKYLIKKL